MESLAHAPCCSILQPDRWQARNTKPHLQSCLQRQTLPCHHQSVCRWKWHLKATQRRDPIIAPFIQLGADPQDGTDMFGYLLRNRIIFIGARIDDKLATQIVASLMALENLNPNEDIKMYINSSGGQAYSVVSILDAMAVVKPDISTVAFGVSASTATLILAAGTKGKRYAMPNARVMMHQPIGGAMGSADEVNIQASELNRTLKVVHSFYSKFTGLPIETVQEETDRDNFMSPIRAKELGIIDGII